eukprot:Skav235578  [mRNA]  locus=scaffold612:113586:114717:- [translate_table: standard]
MQREIRDPSDAAENRQVRQVRLVTTAKGFAANLRSPGTSTAVKRASRSSSIPYFFLILPCAAAMPNAPTARVATARGSENSGHFCKYPSAVQHSETFRVMFGYTHTANFSSHQVFHFLASSLKK